MSVKFSKRQKAAKSDVSNPYPFGDIYNCSMETMIRDESQRNALTNDYKHRFFSKFDKRLYGVIIKKDGTYTQLK